MNEKNKNETERSKRAWCNNAVKLIFFVPTILSSFFFFLFIWFFFYSLCDRSIKFRFIYSFHVWLGFHFFISVFLLIRSFSNCKRRKWAEKFIDFSSRCSQILRKLLYTRTDLKEKQKKMNETSWNKCETKKKKLWPSESGILHRSHAIGKASNNFFLRTVSSSFRK